MGYLQDVREHWESQISRHREAYQIGGVFLLGGAQAAGAYAKVVEQNQIARAQEANEGALKEIAQSGGQTSLGATGTFQISEGIKEWIPFALLFVVVLYFIFKD